MCLNTEVSVGLHLWADFFVEGDLLMNSNMLGNCYVQSDTKKRELSKNPTKIEEIQEKKILAETEPLQLAF